MKNFTVENIASVNIKNKFKLSADGELHVNFRENGYSQYKDKKLVLKSRIDINHVKMNIDLYTRDRLAICNTVAGLPSMKIFGTGKLKMNFADYGREEREPAPFIVLDTGDDDKERLLPARWEGLRMYGFTSGLEIHNGANEPFFHMNVFDWHTLPPLKETMFIMKDGNILSKHIIESIIWDNPDKDVLLKRYSGCLDDIKDFERIIIESDLTRREYTHMQNKLYKLYNSVMKALHAYTPKPKKEEQPIVFNKANSSASILKIESKDSIKEFIKEKTSEIPLETKKSTVIVDSDFQEILNQFYSYQKRSCEDDGATFTS